LHINWYIVELIVISSDLISMGIDSGVDSEFDGEFGSGLFDRFHLAVLGYQPQQSI
jgi:hypothetical protein